MSRRQGTAKRAFVLEVGGRAVLVFPAGSARQATDFCAQEWFTAELGAYRSGGQPIWDSKSGLTIRCADAREAAKLDIALETELVRGEYDDIFSRSSCRSIRRHSEDRKRAEVREAACATRS